MQRKGFMGIITDCDHFGSRLNGLDGLQEPLTDNKNITSESKIVDVDSGNT